MPLPSLDLLRCTRCGRHFSPQEAAWYSGRPESAACPCCCVNQGERVQMRHRPDLLAFQCPRCGCGFSERSVYEARADNGNDQPDWRYEEFRGRHGRARGDRGPHGREAHAPHCGCPDCRDPARGPGSFIKCPGCGRPAHRSESDVAWRCWECGKTWEERGYGYYSGPTESAWAYVGFGPPGPSREAHDWGDGDFSAPGQPKTLLCRRCGAAEMECAPREYNAGGGWSRAVPGCLPLRGLPPRKVGERTWATEGDGRRTWHARW
jgi:hypothetical protein